MGLPFARKARYVAGIDEVGRGPLAGPVVAAAVILPEEGLAGVCDSKTMTARSREAMVPVIRSAAVAWAIGRAEVEEIDRLNILQATFLAMRRAVDALQPAADFALVDGHQCPQLPCPVEPVVRGDSSVAAIAAASILAKVARDAEMVDLDGVYPGYGLARHKGYGTREHRQALERLGPTPIHRRSFNPVRDLVERGIHPA
ncbi:MAG: ribonuclease HII [Ectothiorhodospiraceae bacterium]|jgi:ribonuclease HII